MDDSIATGARRDLETIRTLMERARHYRHPPASAAFAAGGVALAAAYLTHVTLGTGGPGDAAFRVGAVWGAAFALALASTVALTYRASKLEGFAFWSPLAKDVIHALWPPLVTALALGLALVRAERPGLVPAVWMLCYGIGGIASGAYARRAVRRMGAAFLAAGLAQLWLGLPAPLALGATFGGFHLVYGLVVALRPSRA